GVYPNFNWLPDNRTIIIWANGKINRLDTQTHTAEVIPFEVEASHEIVDAVRFRQDIDPDKFRVHAIRGLKTSPDGKSVIFNAAGYLWTKTLPDGQPQRLTNSSDFEFDPAFSPDGRSVVYVTWSDENMGQIKILDLNRRNRAPRTLTSEKGIYREPAFSPDGKTIVFRKERGNGHQGYVHTLNP